MISTALKTVVVVADIALVGLLLATITLAARRCRTTTAPASDRGRDTAASPTPTAYWLAGIALAGWASVVGVLAHGGTFASSPTTRVPVIGLAIVLPVIVGRALLGAPTFRAVIDRVPVAWLVGIQAYRIVGGVFLIAYLQDAMPAEFALPAGIGDVLVGLTAPVVAYRLATAGPGRAASAAIAWCAFGITDLVVAVACGFLTAPSVFQQLALATPNAAITRWPFVLIPTFAVPVSVVLHLCVLNRLGRRRQTALSGVGVGRA